MRVKLNGTQMKYAVYCGKRYRIWIPLSKNYTLAMLAEDKIEITLIRFLLAIVAINRFETIYQYFPVRGHSFLQCDRNFGTAKRLIRKDRIYVPNEYNNLILAAKNRGSTVKLVASNDILDFENSWQRCFKKSCKSLDKATTFRISQYRSFECSSSHKGYLICSNLSMASLKLHVCFKNLLQTQKFRHMLLKYP